jgi:hypothetical protein
MIITIDGMDISIPQRIEINEWDTDFMHLFGLPEVTLSKFGWDYIYSNVPYINAILNAQRSGKLAIPYVKLFTEKGGYGGIGFGCKYATIKIQGYGGGWSLLASIEPKNLVHYDMSKLSKLMPSSVGFGGIDWNKYRNKNGIISDSKKIQFLTDLIKYKTKHATSQH